VGGVFRSPRRGLLFALGVGLIVGGVVWLRRGRKPSPSEPAPRARRELDALKVVTSYRSLEAALAARGIARPPSAPPLVHAMALQHAGHPLGAEVVALTRIYLEVRFGGRTLTDALRADFARRVENLRKHRPDDGRQAA
jgi:hypothetical protein